LSTGILTETALPNFKKELTMKKEDYWMVGLVAFAILWVTFFGLGLMG
jgi:hypothetical protein